VFLVSLLFLGRECGLVIPSLPHSKIGDYVKRIKRAKRTNGKKNGKIKFPNLISFPGGKKEDKKDKTILDSDTELSSLLRRKAYQKELRRELEDYKTTVHDDQVKNLSFKKVANAIIDCDGLIMKTAIRLNVSYKRLTKYLNNQPKLKDLLKDTTEALLDLTETKLRDLILQGDRTAIVFHLRCKGRHRGWIDDGAPDIGDLEPVTFNYELHMPKHFKIVPIEKEKIEKKVEAK
jgi:hypothetical protein